MPQSKHSCHSSHLQLVGDIDDFIDRLEAQADGLDTRILQDAAQANVKQNRGLVWSRFVAFINQFVGVKAF